MNNLTTSLNYEYSPFGQELAEIARAVLPLTVKPDLKAHEYDLLGGQPYNHEKRSQQTGRRMQRQHGLPQLPLLPEYVAESAG